MKTLLITALLIISTAVSAASVNLQGTEWGSDYMTDKTRYTLFFRGNNEVSVIADPNRCLIDELGRVNGCDKMRVNFTTYRMEVAPVKSNRRTMAFDLVPMSPTTSGEKLRLVTNLPFNKINLEALRLVIFNLEGNAVESIRLLQK